MKEEIVHKITFILAAMDEIEVDEFEIDELINQLFQISGISIDVYDKESENCEILTYVLEKYACELKWESIEEYVSIPKLVKMDGSSRTRVKETINIYREKLLNREGSLNPYTLKNISKIFTFQLGWNFVVEKYRNNKIMTEIVEDYNNGISMTWPEVYVKFLFYSIYDEGVLEELIELVCNPLIYQNRDFPEKILEEMNYWLKFDNKQIEFVDNHPILKGNQGIKRTFAPDDDSDDAYVLDYYEQTITINRVKLHTNRYLGGVNDEIMKLFYENPNQAISLRKINSILRKHKTTSDVHGILYNMGFKDIFKKIFFESDNKEIVFHNPVTKERLAGKNVEWLVFSSKIQKNDSEKK